MYSLCSWSIAVSLQATISFTKQNTACTLNSIIGKNLCTLQIWPLLDLRSILNNKDEFRCLKAAASPFTQNTLLMRLGHRHSLSKLKRPYNCSFTAKIKEVKGETKWDTLTRFPYNFILPRYIRLSIKEQWRKKTLDHLWDQGFVLD